jgi:hypothetical protein
MDIAAVLLGLLALVVSVIALKLAFQHIEQIDNVLGRIEKVSEQSNETAGRQETLHTDIVGVVATLDDVIKALPTRYLGEFPRFLADIIQLIEASNNTLTISCDFPGYAKFSELLRADDYQNALAGAAQRIKHIDVQCLHLAARRTHRLRQFPDDNWVRSHSSQVSSYLKHVHAGSQELTHENLINELDNRDAKALTENPAFNAVYSVSDHMPVYFWIADGKEAVFAIQVSAKSSEYGFHTSDAQLINGLLAIQDRYGVDPPTG